MPPSDLPVIMASLNQRSLSASSQAALLPQRLSPSLKSRSIILPSVNLNTPVGAHSPRRRNSLSSQSTTPLTAARHLLTDTASPSSTPQQSHGSLRSHEHSVPLDLPPLTLSQATNSQLNTAGHSRNGSGSGPTTVTDSSLTVSQLHSVSARRNSRPLLWSGSNGIFKTFLSQHTVAQLMAESKPQSVVEVDSTMPPHEGFDKLLKANVLAAPVYDHTAKQYIGFLDVRDLVSSLIFAHESEALHVPWAETWIDVYKRGLARKYDGLGSASVAYLARRTPFKPVHKEHNLIDVAKALSTRLHRVPVVDPSSERCIHIISQSSIINYFIKHRHELRDEWKQSIQSLSIGLCKVMCATADQSAWSAFKLLEVSGVSGLAVIDKDGKLVGNTSARDLKLFVLDRGHLSLDVPIMTYLSQIRQLEHIDEVHPSCSVTLSATIGYVMELMAATKYHRVFIIDVQARPIGVLSVTDILRFACADTPPPNILTAHSPSASPRSSISAVVGSAFGTGQSAITQTPTHHAPLPATGV